MHTPAGPRTDHVDLPRDDAASSSPSSDASPDVGIEVVPIHADDHDLLASRADLFVALHDHDVPYGPPAARRSLLLSLAHEFPGGVHERWVAVRGREVVGEVHLELPTRDNTGTVLVDLFVHPAHRSRGLGTRLAELAIARTREVGRHRIITEALVDGPELPAGRWTEHLWTRLGARRALVEVRRRLVLADVDREAFDRLEADAVARSGAYRLERWQDEAPDALVEGIVALEARMSTDVPLGDLDYEPEQHDAARWRASEVANRGRLRRSYGIAAVEEATGEVAGYTMVGVDPEVPDHAWQWGTIVLPHHRGRRLGFRLKTATHRWIPEVEPLVQTFDTWNAAENAPMIAVNEALGYRVLDHWAELQLDLDPAG